MTGKRRLTTSLPRVSITIHLGPLNDTGDLHRLTRCLTPVFTRHGVAFEGGQRAIVLDNRRSSTGRGRRRRRMNAGGAKEETRCYDQTSHLYGGPCCCRVYPVKTIEAHDFSRRLVAGAPRAGRALKRRSAAGRRRPGPGFHPPKPCPMRSCAPWFHSALRQMGGRRFPIAAARRPLG